MPNQPPQPCNDDQFNITNASTISLPSPAATSGWSTSIGSGSNFGEGGATPTLSPISTIFTNSPLNSLSNAAGATAYQQQSYDSFDDPLSVSQLHSFRSSSPSMATADLDLGEMSFSNFSNVAGSRRSVDFRPHSVRSSTSSSHVNETNAIMNQYQKPNPLFQTQNSEQQQIMSTLAIKTASFTNLNR